MQRAVLLVASGALVCMGVEALLLGPLSAGEPTRGAALGVYLMALPLAFASGILSDVAALRRQRLVRSLAVALVTLVGAVGAFVSLPLVLAAIEDLSSSPPLGKPHPPVPGAFLAVVFAPLVILPLVALGALLLPRARQGKPDRDGGSSATEAAAPTPPVAPAARQPKNRQVLDLLSMVTGLVGPAAVSLTVVLYHLAFAVWCPRGGVAGCPPLPPAGQLVMGLVRALEQLIPLTLPAAVVALIGGHLALARMRRHPAPRRWRRVALWGLILGYSAPVFLGAYSEWLLLTGQFGGE